MSARFERFVFAILLVSAIAVQLSVVPGYSLKLDQSQVLYIAWDFVNQGIFPVHGILSSLHAYNPSTFIWLFILPLKLIGDHRWVLTLPALTLHILSILLLYKMGKKYFTSGVGLLAAALYAFLPNGDYFGHSSWAQGLLAPFYVLVIFGISQWLLENKPWAVAYLLPLTAYIAGMHLGGILIFGVLVLAAMFFRATLRPTAIFVGILVSVLLWLPYLHFEQSRAFVDILAVVRGPLPMSEPWEVTSLCKGPEVNSPQEMERLGNIIKLRWPWFHQFYQSLHKLYSYFRTLISGFAWSLSVNFSRGLGTWQDKAIFFLGRLLFVIGLGGLVYRCCFRKNGSLAEQWLLMVCLLPMALQNLSPYTSISRPDIAWLFYGPQMLVSAYTLTLPRGTRAMILKTVLVVVAGGMLAISFSSIELRLWPGNYVNYVHPQRQMVDWIAKDLQAQGIREASIRYDFLSDMPAWCWVASYATLDSHYYIGTQFDYLLLTRYNFQNTAKAMDGWAENPDYIVLFKEGMERYDGERDKYQIVEFDNYVVLKVLKHAP